MKRIALAAVITAATVTACTPTEIEAARQWIAALAATVDSTIIAHLDGYDRLDLDPEVLMLSSGEQAVITIAQRLQLIGLDLDYLDARYQRAVLEAIAKAAAVLNGVTS